MALFFSENHFVLAVQRACVLLIPVVLLDSLCYLLAGLPITSYQDWLDGDGYVLVALAHLVTRVNNNYLGLMFAFLIGALYTPEKEHNIVLRLTCGLVAVYSFLINVGFGRHGFDVYYLGSGGMFSAVMSSLLCCPLFYLVTDKISHLFRKYHRMMNPFLSSALKTAPTLVYVPLVFYMVRDTVWMCTGCLNLQEFFFKRVSRDVLMLFSKIPLLQALIQRILVQLIWLTGTNGSSALQWFNQTHFEVATQANYLEIGCGNAPTHILTTEFTQLFLSIGGSGCGLALILLMIFFSKRRQDHTIACMGIVPTIFNVNEVLAYGVPIIMNPVYAVPFILAPVVNMLISYPAMASGIVPVTSVAVDWTTPIVISGYLSTGSIRGSILQILLLVLDGAIYYPFLRINERFQEDQYMNSIRELERYVREKELVEEPVHFKDVPYLIQHAADSLSTDLHMDLQAGKLQMFYQAQVDAAGNYAGAEALIRWDHPVAGYIYPPLVIALARESGFLDELEKFIFSSAAAVIKKLEEENCIDPKISVNITGTSMAYAGFEEMVDATVQNYGIAREHLWIEITEQESIASTATLQKLKAQGHHLLIDDFGMGHTSIYYLETKLFDVVKLDGSVISKVLTDESAHEIVESVIRLSHRLGMTVVAEYVETEEQKDELKKIQCDVFQGRLYSQALPGKLFREKVSELCS